MHQFGVYHVSLKSEFVCIHLQLRIYLFVQLKLYQYKLMDECRKTYLRLIPACQFIIQCISWQLPCR